MRTQLNASPIFTQGIADSQVSMMDMDLDGMKQACQIFRDNIYTNKILAVVREWTSNAVDEHLKHGIDRHVEIGIKDGRFFVRDFAQGLSDDGIRNVFGKYFRSTKSNSDQPIGGFGVGAKAGHCYNDTFYVTSHFQGTKTIYSCILGGDESGASIGQVVEMSKEPTNESGLHIEIEIAPNDHSDFITHCREMVEFATLAKINFYAGLNFSTPDKVLIAEQDGIKIFFIDGSPSLKNFTMGGVLYKTPQSFEGFDFLSGVTPKGKIQIDVPVGFFDVPISRESFRDTFKFKTGIQKCGDLLKEAIEKDCAAFSNKPMSFYAENNTTQGRFFSFACKKFLPSGVAVPLVGMDFYGESQYPLFKYGNNFAVCVLSKSYSHRMNQKDKIDRIVADRNIRVFIIEEGLADSLQNQFKKHNITSDFVFGKWQKFFPLPKSKANVSDDKFSVYFVGRGTRRSLNAIELHNVHWDSNCQNEQEVKQFMQDRISKIKNKTDLERCTITPIGLSRHRFSAKALNKAMVSLGYFTWENPQYKNIKENLTKEASYRQTVYETSRKLLGSIGAFVSHKTRSKIQEAYQSNCEIKIDKIINRASQMEKVFDSIMKKDSSCEIAKVFLNFVKDKNGYGSYSAKRKDIRLAIKSIINS